MPAGPLAVDTDVFSFVHLRKGPHARFSPFLTGRRLALPFPVIGELRALGHKTGSQWGPDRVAELERVIELCVPIPSDDAVTGRYAPLHAKLSGQCGHNDLWIASCCLAIDLPLVTNNLDHFQAIADEAPELRLLHPDL